MRCVHIFPRLKNKFQDDLLFMSFVVTCDETWAYHLDDLMITTMKEDPSS